MTDAEKAELPVKPEDEAAEIAVARAMAVVDDVEREASQS